MSVEKKTIVKDRYERLNVLLPFRGDNIKWLDLNLAELCNLKARLYSAFVTINARYDEKVMSELINKNEIKQDEL